MSSAMQLRDWLKGRGYGAHSTLCKDIAERVKRPISRQLLNAYLNGNTTPPQDVRSAILILTKMMVKKEDWMALAVSRGRSMVSPSGKPRRPYRTANLAPPKRRSKK